MLEWIVAWVLAVTVAVIVISQYLSAAWSDEVHRLKKELRDERLYSEKVVEERDMAVVRAKAAEANLV